MKTDLTYSRLIKSNTALAHARTERALILKVKSINTVATYAELLYCLYGYFRPIEQMIDGFADSLINDYQQRRKSDRILEDLQLFNYSRPSHFAADLPIIKDLNQAFGCLYVLEGSVLGGAIIKRVIQTQCPFIPDQSFSYFSGYHDQTAAMWQSFIIQFDNFFTTDEQLHAVANSANECFEKLERWINHGFAGLGMD